MSEHPFIQTVTEANFDQAVISASYECPILVDFWADWCQPCKVLMPILSSLAEQYNGKFILAKVNTEEHQALAAANGIRSLPTVRLYIDGEAVDEFMGALPEEKIRDFLDQHIPNETDITALQALELAAEGEVEQAITLLNQAAEREPDNDNIRLAQAKIAFAVGDFEQTRTIIDSLPLEMQNEVDVCAIKAQLNLAAKLSVAPPADALQQRLDANPNDSEARYLLAMRAIEAGDYEAALQLLLILMQKDRAYQDDAARQTMLDVFDLLGGEGQLVTRYRGKMFNLLH
jgi:putative thioredoxin